MKEEDQYAKHSWNDQLPGVVQQPSEVESELFSVVIRNVVEWLHVFQEASVDESSDDSVFILIKGGLDLVSISFMKWEVINYDFTFD